jgi:hypothetical protein
VNVIKGMGIAVAILLTFGLTQWWTMLVTAADAHSGLAAWVQAAGAILALVAAFLIPIHLAQREHSRQRKIAALKIQVRMWRWVEKSTFKVFSVNGWDDVHEPEPECDLPKIPYSTSLENITQLHSDHALELLQIVDRRERILSKAAATAYYEHSINAMPPFEAKSATLILDAVELLERIARTAGLPGRALDATDRARLEKIKADFEASQARSAETAADF